MTSSADPPALDAQPAVGTQRSGGERVAGRRIAAQRRAPNHDAAGPADAGTDNHLDTDLDEADASFSVPSPAAPSDPALTDREREILAFEQRWWRHAGAKEQAIRDTFDLSATRYYQLLNGLLDNPAALAAAPLLVGRLRRLRASRSRTRRR